MMLNWSALKVSSLLFERQKTKYCSAFNIISSEIVSFPKDTKLWYSFTATF